MSKSITSQRQILVVDDDRRIREILLKFLRNKGYDVICAANGSEALDFIKEINPALIFLDIEMPKLGGLRVLEELKALEISTPVIIISGHSEMDNTITAMRSGAYDFLTKPFDLNKIHDITKRCLGDSSASELPGQNTVTPVITRKRYELVGSSPSIVSIYKIIGSVSATNNMTNVLITGESGTGKELVARQIHMWSAHADAQFVALNMTALPDNLIESELFGYDKGAFTGADKRKPGQFELAGSGTIFLDEIGGLSLDMQQKLLRVLQEREYYRLGGRHIVPINCRIVAATNEDLKNKLKTGEFRKDLYFRLNVVSIHLPSLPERKEDIPILVHYFLNKSAMEMNRNVPNISKEAIQVLTDYDWPGNIRELENTIARLMAINYRDNIIPEDFSDLQNTPKALDPPIPHQNLEEARHLLNEAFEIKFITQGLRQAAGNISKAAAHAGISRQRYHQLMKKHSINPDLYR